MARFIIDYIHMREGKFKQEAIPDTVLHLNFVSYIMLLMDAWIVDESEAEAILRRGAEIFSKLAKKYGRKGVKKFIKNLVNARKTRRERKAKISGRKVRFKPVIGGVLAIDSDGAQYFSKDDIYSVAIVVAELEK